MVSQKVFVVLFAIFVASAVSKPFTIDVFELKDSPSKSSDLVKRTADDFGNNDVAELNIPKISLSSFLSNVETGLVQSALSVSDVGSNPNAHVQFVTTPHTIAKRSTVTETNTPSDISTPSDINTPIVLVQTTERVLADELKPAHVVIDRLSIFTVPASGGIHFPDFHLYTSNEADEVVESKTGKDSSSSSSSSSESSDSSDSSDSSEEHSSKSTATSTSTTSASIDITSSTVTDAPSSSSLSSDAPSSSLSPSSSSTDAPDSSLSSSSPSTDAPDSALSSSSSSTDAPSSLSLSSSSSTPSLSTSNSTSSSSLSSSSSTSPSTTLLPLDEKKTVEKDLKTKVAEVEAEPVILTARV